MFSLDGLLAYSKLNLINVSHPHNNSKGENGKDVAASDTYLLQVHGRTPLTTYGTQVALKAASLNTNDCFVLVTPKGNWISQFFSAMLNFCSAKFSKTRIFPAIFSRLSFSQELLTFLSTT